MKQLLEKTYDIVALGELLIDFSHVKNNDIHYPVLSALPGGAPSNLLAVNSSYGMKTALISKVGDDTFGHLLIDTLLKLKIDAQYVQVAPDAFTTLAFVTLDEEGDRSFSFARKPGADTQIQLSDQDRELLKDCKIFHFGSLSMTDEPSKSSTLQAVQEAKKAGAWINFDPNLREKLWKNLDDARESFIWGIAQSDSIKISLEEAAFIYGNKWEEIEQGLAGNPNLKLTVITRGKEGCTVITPSFEFSLDGFSVNTVDTTGAGDIFTGALLFRLLQKGMEFDETYLKESARFATACAALSTEKRGGISSIPELDRVLKFLEK